MFFILLLAWFALVMIVVVGLLVRNQLVWAYRGVLIAQIDMCSKNDIGNHRPWRWRYDMYNAVSYERMLYSTRRFRSFYQDRSFLDLNAVDPQTRSPKKIGT